MPRRNLVAIHLEGLDNASPALASFLGNLQKWAKRVLSIAAIVGGIRLVSMAIKELTQNAAEIEGIERAFISLTASVGRSNKEMLSALRESSRGMVNNLELMRSFNLASQLVSRQFATELPQAFEMLTKVSIATGESMTYLVDSLVRGIGRLNPRILDNLGVQIDLNSAYKKFAGELGKTAEALTKTDKQTIAWMATLERLKINTAALPDVTNTLAFQYAVLQTNITNVRQEIERSFAPVLTNLYRRINELIEGPLTGFGNIMRNWVAPAIDVVIDRFGAIATAAKESMESGMGAFLDKAKKWAWNAIVWGNNIMINFADGMIRGATTAIITVMKFINRLLTSWLAPGSPPKVAPSLAEWGAEAFTEYLKGFFDAQFNVLEGLQEPIKRALQSLVDMGELAEDALGPAFVNISKTLAASIPEMVKIGKISQDVIDTIRASVGGYADEILDLLQKQLNLADAVDKVRIAEENLEASRTAHEAAKDRVRDIADEYNRLLAAGAGEDILAPLRDQFKEARKGLGVTREQVKEAEVQKTEAESRLGFLEEQVRLQERLLDQLFSMSEALKPLTESTKKAKKGIADIMDELEVPEVPEGLDLSGGLDAQFQMMKDKINALLDELLLPWKEKWEKEWLPQLLEAKKQWDLFTGAVKLFWDERVKPIMEDLDKIIPTEGFLANLAQVAGWFAIGAAAALIFKAALLGIGTIIGAINWPLLLIIGTLALLKTAWDNNWLGMRDVIQKFLGEEFPGIIQSATEWFQRLADFLTAWWGMNVKPILDQLKVWWETNWPIIAAIFLTAWTIIQDIIQAVVGVIVEQVWPQLQEAFANLKEAVNSLGIDWSAVWERVKTIIVFVCTAVGVAIALIVGIIVGMVGAIAGAINAISKYFDDWRKNGEILIEGLTRLFGGFIDFFKNIFTGQWGAAWESLKSMAQGAVLIIIGVANGIRLAIGTMISLVAGLLKGFVKAFLGFFFNLYNELIGHSIVWDIINDIVSAFKDTDWLGIGKGIIQGVKQGIIDKAHSLAKSAVDAVKGAIQAAKDFIQGNSPSKLAAKAIGMPIAQGIGEGMLQNTPSKQMEQMLDMLMKMGSGAAGDTYNFNQTVNTRATQMNTMRDFAMARALYAD